MRILNIEDQLKFQISSLMWDYDKNNLPEHLGNYFKRTNLVHNYEIPGAAKGNLFIQKLIPYLMEFNLSKFKELRH